MVTDTSQSNLSGPQFPLCQMGGCPSGGLWGGYRMGGWRRDPPPKTLARGWLPASPLLQSWGENQAAHLTPMVPPAQTEVVGRAQARGSGENSMSHPPAGACPSRLRTGSGRFHR